VSGEYSLTLIRTTLTAIPIRPIVLAAKALVLTVPVAAAGGLTLLACLLITRITLSGNEIATGRGYPRLSLTDGLTLRAGFGTVGLPGPDRRPDPHLHRLLERFTPMNAGLAVQATTDLDHLPVSPSAGALLTGVVLLQRRDT
jgi:ABC-2 type transport system permease protein